MSYLRAFGGCLALAVAALAGPPPPTHFERSEGLETPRLAGTLAECQALAQASPRVSMTRFGTSPQGRDLALVIVDKDGLVDPRAVRAAGRAVVLIQACIHAGEPEGKDAGLLFLRDLAVTGKYTQLLDRLTFLFIPVFNVDGHERFSAFNRINQNGPKEMGWRTSAANLNLNRDYLKADAPEMQAWLKMHQSWLPDFFIDCHTTDGADYQYQITYGLDDGGEGGGYLEPRLARWTLDTYRTEFEARMTRQGLPVFPYVTFREWHNPRSGLVGGAASPMYSTGYQSAQNRPGILLETHMLKPYRQRVEATYAALRHTAEILYRERDTLLRLVQEADAFTASKAFRDQPMALVLAETGRSEPVAFKGYEYTAEPSDLSGGTWFKYDNRKPVVFPIPFSRELKATASARLPEAYLIPPEWAEVIARLDYHGIRYQRLAAARTVPVASCRFEGVQWGAAPVEGRFRVTAATPVPVQESRLYPAGSVLVPTGQRTARLIAHLLEPDSADSLLKWGFFNAIFEQKEYGESYVLEGLAREMLAADPALRAEFQRKKAADPAFASHSEAILNWFYTQSAYRDTHLNLYPVGKVLDPATLRELLGPEAAAQGTAH